MSDARNEVIEYLLKPENIGAAFDLQAELPRVIDRLHIKFWSTLKSQVQERLESEGITEWSVQLPGGDPEKAVDDPYYYLEICPADGEDEPYIGFIVQQRNKSGKSRAKLAELYYGISINADGPPIYSSKKYNMKELPSEVQAVILQATPGWRFDEGGFASDGTAWNKMLGRAIRDKNEVLLLARNSPPHADVLEKEIVVKLFDLFRESRKSVERANAALKLMHESQRESHESLPAK
jgi:hypothetical protein